MRLGFCCKFVDEHNKNIPALFYWNKEANQWALTFLKEMDIQCEAKNKNNASKELSKQVP